jgi:serine/threonine protein phosphatase 1
MLGCDQGGVVGRAVVIMPDRIIAIGDIHGCSAALDAVLAAIDPRPGDTIVTLGDYIDRGPDARGAIDRLLALAKRCRLVPILGNHDEMLLEIVSYRPSLLADWLSFGGDATLASYGGRLEQIPEEHVAFLRDCVSWHESDGHFFVHASYDPRKPLNKQPLDVLRWESIRDRVPGPHRSGKVAVLSHTSQKNGEVLDLGHLICIDTWVYGDGWLTALEVQSGQLWQADKNGRMREP